MTSPIGSVMDQISVDWAALVPSDRPTIRYAELTGRETSRGTAADRRFTWGPAQRLETLAVTGDTDYVEWSVVAVMVLSRAGRRVAEHAAAAASETQALVSTVLGRAAWPADILDVQDISTSIEYDETSGDALCTLAFRALCAETLDYTYGSPLAPPSSDTGDEIEIIEPDPDLLVGDGEVTIGSIGLVVGTYSIVVSMWCDDSTSTATTVTVRLRGPGDGELESWDSTSTSPEAITHSVAITTAGVHTFTAQTGAITGVARVDSIQCTRSE